MSFKITIEQFPDGVLPAPGIVVWNGIENFITKLNFDLPGRSDPLDSIFFHEFVKPIRSNKMGIEIEMIVDDPISWIEHPPGPARGIVKRPDRLETSAPKMIEHKQPEVIDAEFIEDGT